MDYLKHHISTVVFALFELFICIKIIQWSFKNGWGVYHHMAIMFVICSFINMSSLISKVMLNSNPDQYILFILYYLTFGVYFIYYYYMSGVLGFKTALALFVLYSGVVIAAPVLQRDIYFQFTSISLLLLFYFLSVKGFLYLINQEASTHPVTENPLLWISCGLLIYSLIFSIRDFPRFYFNSLDPDWKGEVQTFLRDLEFTVSILVWFLFFIGIRKHNPVNQR